MADSFGQTLRRLREAAGLSQPELARRVPISQSSLSRYESDRQAVAPEVAARLDDVLGAGGSLVAARPPSAGEVLTRDDRDRIAHHISYPSRVDGCTVRALADLLAAQRRLDDTLGPTPLISSTLAQVDTVTGMARHATGTHRDDLLEVAAEWVQFAGWLHAEARHDGEATRFLAEAEHLADAAGSGILAAQAANFRGYLARQQGNARGVVRWFLAEHLTPGAHIAQRVGAAAQAAHGHALLGERDTALRLLDVAGGLLDDAAREDPPRTAYWLTPTFHRLNLGLAHLALGDHHTATDHLAAGLDALPPDQQTAEWTREYRSALDTAHSAA
ncbi:helix-turn-helix transcriptional regulator [Saccharomonospora iraqiensis]|uniref:helix-turn-helix transcriptional regulator n=1 Tax=Saccharomonospora iraqiensis TaxID=52698 RepID=UPI00022DECD5|nr:helix-turn-helix transcriptional regulator [Saccharomonospora iraqiensis]